MKREPRPRRIGSGRNGAVHVIIPSLHQRTRHLRVLSGTTGRTLPAGPRVTETVAKTLAPLHNVDRSLLGQD